MQIIIDFSFAGAFSQVRAVVDVEELASNGVDSSTGFGVYLAGQPFIGVGWRF